MDSNVLKCNCFTRPFEPPKGCHEYCVAMILRYAKPNELVDYFYFDNELADKLFEITSNDKLNNLKDFSEYLEEDEFEITSKKFKNIDDRGWDWIEKTLKMRIESEMFVTA